MQLTPPPGLHHDTEPPCAPPPEVEQRAALHALARLAARVADCDYALVALREGSHWRIAARHGLAPAATVHWPPPGLAMPAAGAPITLADLRRQPPDIAAGWASVFPGAHTVCAHLINDANGHATAVLCVADRRARPAAPATLAALNDLATMAVQHLPSSPAQVRSPHAVVPAATGGSALTSPAEAPLQALTETDLRAVLENAQDAFVAIDGYGRVIEWNRQATWTFGYEREKALGEPLEALIVPPDHQEPWAVMLQAVASAEHLTGLRQELHAMRRDGSTVPCAMTATALRASDGGTVCAAFLQDVSETHLAARRHAETAARMQDLYDHAPCGYYSLDQRGKFVQINQTLLGWIGKQREEVIGLMGSADFFTDEGRAAFRAIYADFLATGRAGPLEFDLISAQGDRRRVSVIATAVYDDAGVFRMSRTVMYDVTELERMRSELQEVNRMQALMLDNDMIGITRMQGRRFVWVNRAICNMLGYEAEELRNHDSASLHVDAESYAAFGDAARAAMAAAGTYRTQVQLRRRDGDLVWFDLSGAQLRPEGGETLWLLSDISRMKQYQQQVERLAFQDALTGLPNRLQLMENLNAALAAASQRETLMAVAFLDLDGFKGVNDTHGHDAGDELLREVAQRLQQCVRANDTVARLGGDEFVLTLAQINVPDGVQRVVERVNAALCAPIALSAGIRVTVGCSIGVAVFPEHGRTAHELLARADAAMYEAKRARTSPEPHQPA